jgi:hypothetical protein
MGDYWIVFVTNRAVTDVVLSSEQDSCQTKHFVL